MERVPLVEKPGAQQQMQGAIAITTVFLTVALGGLAGAMARATLEWPHVVFAAFFILFRVKMFLDDLAFLRSATPRDAWFLVGFLVGTASWFFWLLSALCVQDLLVALEFGLVAVVLSTIWTVMEGARAGFRGLHTLWLAVNVFYLASGGIVWWGEASPSRLGGLFAAWFGVCLLDTWFSKSWESLPQ